MDEFNGRHLSADRLNVALIRKAADDLQLMADRTGLSQGDIVNRALSLYEYIDDRLRHGDQILLRAGDSGMIEHIRFF
jgi:hypothetical protein